MTPQQQQFSRNFSFGLVLLCFAFFMVSMIVGDNLVLPWEIEESFKTRPLLLEYFELNGDPSGLYVDQLISWQKFVTNDIQYLGWAENMLLLVFLVTLISLTTIVTYLDRTSYFIVSALVVFVLIQLRLEELGISDPYLTYGTIGGFLLTTYIFQSFYPQAQLWKRFLATIGLYGILGIIILTLANVEHPNLLTISFGIFAPLILAAVFIIFIAGDNVYSLFKLTTQGSRKGKNGLIHFSIIGSIYLFLVTLLLLQRLGETSIDLLFVQPESLIVFSIISGYFCLERKMESIPISIDLPLLKNWLYPVAAALLLCLLGYSRITANDSLTNALNWVIILSHVGFGAAFLFYAWINFIPPLIQNLEIWPLFFKGLRTPILMVRLLAFVLLLGGIFAIDYRPYYQAKSGQYAMLAALGEKIDNSLIADQYYKQSVYYDFYNFKANYQLTRIAKRELEINEVPEKLFNVLSASENPKARVAYANFFADRDELYRELRALMNSREINSSSEVRNNLGLSHYRYTNYDSAYQYLGLNESSAVSEANLAALNYDMASRVNFDTTVTYDFTEDIHLLVNKQALANAQGRTIEFKYELKTDTLLGRDDLFYIYNACLSPVTESYNELLSTVDYYLSSLKNGRYHTFLNTAKAILLYQHQEVSEAFYVLEQAIASNPSASGFPLFMKAVWAYHQGQVQLTIESLENSQKRGYREPQIIEFIAELQKQERYYEKADISEDLSDLLAEKGNLATHEFTNSLTQLAKKNAFDTETTLKAIDLLRSEGLEAEEIYDLLLYSVNLNTSSKELKEAYIYQCVEVGLNSFAQTALSQFFQIAEPYEYEKVKNRYDSLVQVRRNQLFN